MTRNQLINSTKDVIKRRVTAALTDCLKAYSRRDINPLLSHYLYG